jgi:hypothetical protein
MQSRLIDAPSAHEIPVSALLACGWASSLLYVVTDVLGAVNYPGYDYTGQAISELSAIGAPTADLLAPLTTLYSILFALFAAGVWIAAGPRRALRWSAGFMIGLAALGIGWALSPMNMRGHEVALTDTMHMLLSAASVSLLVAIITSGAAAFGAKFRVYSAATVTVMLLFGYLTTLDVPRVAAGLPTPLLGLNERFIFLAWLTWMAVLSIKLLRSRRRKAG